MGELLSFAKSNEAEYQQKRCLRLAVGTANTYLMYGLFRRSDAEGSRTCVRSYPPQGVGAHGGSAVS